MSSSEKFPVDIAQIVGLFMESVFYGCLYHRVFLITFFNCIRVLSWSDGRPKPRSKINFKMLIAATLMFVFASLDVAFGLRHNIDAFIYFNGDPIVEFNETSDWINVMKMVCYVAQTFIGDSILLYRCWIIYSKNYYVVIFSGLMWLAGTVCGIMTCYVEATMTNNMSLLNSRSLLPFITSMLSLTLVMNVTTTSLIVYRIWSIQKALQYRATIASEKSPLFRVMRLLIESGLMYTITIIILFVLYMASNNGQLGVSDSVVQIIGITFNLIITGVDRGEATQPMSHPFRSNHMEGSVPLHTIHIQTTISRYPPDGEPSDPSVAETELKPELPDWK